MRIVTINLAPTSDVPCKPSTRLSAFHLCPNNTIDNISTPYTWTQVESTMAVICACLITYRPLFTHLNLTFLSSLSWTKRSSSVFKRKEQWISTGDTDERHGPMRWSHTGKTNGGKDLHRLEDLNSKATKVDLHVANVALFPMSDLPHSTGNRYLKGSGKNETSYV